MGETSILLGIVILVIFVQTSITAFRVLAMNGKIDKILCQVDELKHELEELKRKLNEPRT